MNGVDHPVFIQIRPAVDEYIRKIRMLSISIKMAPQNVSRMDSDRRKAHREVLVCAGCKNPESEEHGCGLAECVAIKEEGRCFKTLLAMYVEDVLASAGEA